MPAPIEKTINGQPVTPSEFRRAICDVLDRYPKDEGGRMADLVNEFGAEWDNKYGRQFLSTTLNNMKNSGLLAGVDGRRGYYRTTRAASHERGGVTAFEQTENAIVNVLARNGGIMRMREIVDALTPHDAERVKFQGNYNKPNARSGKFIKTEWSRLPKEVRDARVAQGMRYKSFRSQLYKVITQSVRIRKATDTDGWYCLSYDELVKLPQSGSNLSVLMSEPGRRLEKLSIDRGVKDAKVGDWYDFRQYVFEFIGGQVARLVGLSGMTPEEFVDMPQIMKALANFQGYANNAYYDVVVMIRVKRGDDFYEPTPVEMRLKIYELYAAGFFPIHLAMRADFITAVADVFQIDPAMLSFGMVVPRGTLRGY